MNFPDWSASQPNVALMGVSTVHDPFQNPTSYGAAFDENTPMSNFPGNNAAISAAVVVMNNVTLDDTITPGEAVYWDVTDDKVSPEVKHAKISKSGSSADSLRGGILLRPGENAKDCDVTWHARNYQNNLRGGILLSADRMHGEDKYRIVVAIEHFTSVNTVEDFLTTDSPFVYINKA